MQEDIEKESENSNELGLRVKDTIFIYLPISLFLFLFLSLSSHYSPILLFVYFRKIEEISSMMPLMGNLLGTVGLSIPVAFQLVRPLIRAALQKSKYAWPFFSILDSMVHDSHRCHM